MKVVVIDGQGGKLGRLLVESIVKESIPCDIYAIGTNSTATAAMMKGGAQYGATGENPVVVACRDADVIVGPIGIVSADSLCGEITPKMAVAIGQSAAVKLLLPVSHCNNKVVGTKPQSMTEMAAEAAGMIKDIAGA
jgi:hypothetical protein